jgi:hypothetical protein
LTVGEVVKGPGVSSQGSPVGEPATGGKVASWVIASATCLESLKILSRRGPKSAAAKA